MAKTTTPEVDTNAEFVDMSMFDTNLQLQEEGIDVPILRPDNKPSGLVITVYGPDSTAAQKAVIQLTAEVEAEMAADANLNVDSAAAQRRRSIAFLAKITKGWNKPIGSEALAFSEENARTVFTKYPIILDQVKFVADRRGAFIKP